MIILVLKILAIIIYPVSVYTIFFYRISLGILLMFLANFLLWMGDLGNLIEVPWVNILIENYSLEYIIYLLYSTIEWGIWNVGKYVLIAFIIIVVITTVLKLVKNYQSNKKVDIKNKEEQSYKVLIIDNNMENLFALKKESFIVEEVKIIKKYKYTPKTKEELKALVKDESIYLGDIDTKYITDMSFLFSSSTRKDFSGIEKWDTSNVKDMKFMFLHCENFNYDISSWNVSRVRCMEGMFLCCKNFNQDISGWDVGKVRSMNTMFWGCKNFNQDISGWDVRNVKNMTKMLKECKSFNQDLSSWDVRNVEHRYGMFYESGMEWDDSKKPRFVKE